MPPTKWDASMHGFPWTKGKMAKAVATLRKEGSITFAFGAEKLAKLEMMNEQVFRHRPDLVLHVWSVADNEVISEDELVTLIAMKNIKKLFLNGFANRSLSPLQDMKQLSFLKIGAKKRLPLDFLAGLTRLSRIGLYGRLIGLESVQHCVRLRTVRLSTTIDSFDFFKPLTKVATVSVDACIAPNDFRPLNKPALRDLSITSIRKLEDVQSLADFGNLRSLRLDASRVRRLPDLERLKNLRKLTLKYMKVWSNPRAIQTLPGLRELELSEINTKLKAEEFYFLTEMSSLRKVDFRFMDFNKRRIQKLKRHFEEQGKGRLLNKD